MSDALDNLAQYRLLVESVIDYAIFMLDPKGYILTWNVGAARTKGYTAEDIIGQHFSVFYTEPDRLRNHPANELAIATVHGRYEEEGWRVRKDGTEFWANVVITALHDQSGNLVGFAKVTRDLTERRRAEQRLRDQAEELEAFAYSVSHDLRTPVRHIISFCGLLSGSLANDPKALQHLRFIENAGYRMNGLIDGLLTHARLGRKPLQLQSVNLNELIEDVQYALSPDLTYRDVQWNVSALPVVQGDRELLRGVVTNLLSNALKYTRTRPTASITVWAEETADEVHVHVRDNGVGFEPKYQQQLFSVFKRLHAEKDFEGSGVGLATVKRLIQRHGGHVWAHGRVDEGATFSFSLPCGRLAEEFSRVTGLNVNRV